MLARLEVEPWVVWGAARNAGYTEGCGVPLWVGVWRRLEFAMASKGGEISRSKRQVLRRIYETQVWRRGWCRRGDGARLVW